MADRIVDFARWRTGAGVSRSVRGNSRVARTDGRSVSTRTADDDRAMEAAVRSQLPLAELVDGPALLAERQVLGVAFAAVTALAVGVIAVYVRAWWLL